MIQQNAVIPREETARQNDNLYRLDVTIGQAEFKGEGCKAEIREDYQQFIDVIKLLGAAALSVAEQSTELPEGSTPAIEDVWSRVYIRNGDQISLHGLPPTKSKSPDSILLIIYGFQKLLGMESVKSTLIMESAKQSGVRIDRIDRNLPASHKKYVRKAGTGKGGRYALNNQGFRYVEELIETHFGD